MVVHAEKELALEEVLGIMSRAESDSSLVSLVPPVKLKVIHFSILGMWLITVASAMDLEITFTMASSTVVKTSCYDYLCHLEDS